MATLKDTWNTTAEQIRIQNPNYIMQGLSALHDFGLRSGITYEFDKVIDTRHADYRYMCSNASDFRAPISGAGYQSNTFCHFIPNGTNFTTQTVEDVFPRFYPEMMSAKSFQSKYVSGQNTSGMFCFSNPVPQIYEHGNPVVKDIRWYAPTSTLFRNFAFDDDDLILEYCSFYTNKSDVSEQTLMWNRMYYTSITHTPTCVLQVFNSNTGVYNPVWINMLQLATSAPTNGRISNAMNAAWLALLANAPLKFLMLNRNSDEYQTNFDDCVIYGKKTDWTKFFDTLGLPWSWDIDVVKSPDGDGLRQPTLPGQPENPIIDDDGSEDNITDPVEYPDPPYIPNSTVYDRYFLSPNQIPDIKKFLFSDTFMNNIKRLWTNPAEYVISLVCYPFDVVNTGLGTTNDVVSIGGVTSDVVATALTDRGVPYFYGGSVFVDNYYNSYLDYEPYTSIDIYIPYIGVRPLNVSQVVGHTLCIGYYIDLNTQQITALLGLDGQNGNLGQVLTQYVGSIGVQAPLSGTSAQDMIRNIVTQTSGLITGIGAIAGGVMGANPALFATGVSKTSNEILGGGHTAPSYYGSLSPVSGLFTPQMAYLIINRPRQAIPTAYLSQQGFSSSFSGKVSEFSGYLECTSVNMSSGNTMTEQEQNEITRLLTGGIYI